MKNFTEAQIKETMKVRSINRKSALKFLNRTNGGTKSTPVAGQTLGTSTLGGEPDAAKAPIVDVKARAANDDTAQAPVAPITPKVTAPKVVTLQTAAGKARGEGIRLFKLAGSPKKEQFIHVYGPNGAKWTWEARAKAVGLPSAEAAAAKFQAMLLQPAGTFVVVSDKPVVARAAVAKTKTTTDVNPNKK